MPRKTPILLPTLLLPVVPLTSDRIRQLRLIPEKFLLFLLDLTPTFITCSNFPSRKASNPSTG